MGELGLADRPRDATARPDPVHCVPLVDADERRNEAIVCELSLHGFTRVDANGEGRHLQAGTARTRNVNVCVRWEKDPPENNNNKVLLPYSTCKNYMINWNVVWR